MVGSGGRGAARAHKVCNVWDGELTRCFASPALSSNVPQTPMHPSPASPPAGHPPPPLRTDGGRLVDARGGAPVALRGVNWFGFNNQGGMVDGLWVGGSRADTDLAALTHQAALLGFNAVRLPFTFDALATHGRGQVMDCAPAGPDKWAARATDPEKRGAVDAGAAPAPAVNMPVETWARKLCNTYVPSNETALVGDRLLWAVQYFVASGFYVVVSRLIENVVVPGLGRFKGGSPCCFCLAVPILAPAPSLTNHDDNP